MMVRRSNRGDNPAWKFIQPQSGGSAANPLFTDGNLIEIVLEDDRQVVLFADGLGLKVDREILTQLIQHRLLDNSWPAPIDITLPLSNIAIERLSISRSGIVQSTGLIHELTPRDATILDLNDFVVTAAQHLVEAKMPSDTREYFQSLGPWVTGQSVKESLDVTWETLSAWRDDNKLLGVRFADRKYYYPRQQFRDGLVIPEMKPIVDELMPAYAAPETVLAWFAGEAYEGESTTRWDLLHEGRHQTLRMWAQEDAARILA